MEPMSLWHYHHLSASKLKKIRHGPADLAEKVKEWASSRGEALSEIQQSEILDYRQNEIYRSRNMVDLGDEAVLRAYFNLFDTLFYGATLHSHCTVKLTSPRRRLHADMTQFLLCWHCPPKVLFLTSKIRIFRRDEITDHESRLNFYLGRLLHEMSHAFLELFSCRYEPCLSSLEHLGVTGHGIAWQEIAFTVEKAANDPTFLNLSVDLHRQHSLRREPEASAEAVTSSRLIRWGFSIA